MKKKWLKTLDRIGPADLASAGGKAVQLAQMHRQGMRLPRTRCLSTDAYSAFVDTSGLRERILLELNRKPFGDMRWEEIWDCATRIRNIFLRTPLPEALNNSLYEEIEHDLQGQSVTVRSSAPEEDNARHSFAGLHESYVNVCGTRSVIEHVRKVWASLWSDAALLYRQELSLDAEQSAMAIVIQETIAGDCSGVVFTRNPNAESQAVIESVHGLNQGLVDGAVAPDRWVLARTNGRIIKYEPAQRESYATPTANGVRYVPLPKELRAVSPLRKNQVGDIFNWAMGIEKLQKRPQDVEWTIKNGRIFLLQTRPVSTLQNEAPEDQRKWYLSLHRSYENLVALRDKIEKTLIPEMMQTAEQLAGSDLSRMSVRQLAAEIQARWDINHRWVNIYWADFIPFAHGVRLFGQVYNDTMQPDDPYEFVELLARTKMLSIERNRMLTELADTVRSRSDVAELLKNGQYASLPQTFLASWNAFIEKFGDLSCGVSGATQCDQEMTALASIVLEMAAHPATELPAAKKRPVEDLHRVFIESFPDAERQQAANLLDLARASYQLRDDDNIHLGRIEAQLLAATREGRRRLQSQSGATASNSEDIKQLQSLLEQLDVASTGKPDLSAAQPPDERIQARQLVGQPAGPGVTKGPARVIHRPAELAAFKHGEVLVCDAVDPNMTFVIPLASGVIERRGGMLIHGAIIAREYGLPCVTGVTGVMDMVHTGDQLTVDGFLGIVTVATEG